MTIYNQGWPLRFEKYDFKKLLSKFLLKETTECKKVIREMEDGIISFKLSVAPPGLVPGDPK